MGRIELTDAAIKAAKSFMTSLDAKGELMKISRESFERAKDLHFALHELDNSNSNSPAVPCLDFDKGFGTRDGICDNCGRHTIGDKK